MEKEKIVLDRLKKGIELLYTHDDADGITSAVLLAHAFPIKKVNCPEDFGDFEAKADLAKGYQPPDLVTDMVPKDPEYSGLVIDHHPSHPEESKRKYILVWDGIPTTGIVYKLFKDQIPKEYHWKVAVGLCGDGQPELIPAEIWTSCPSLLDSYTVPYEKYGKITFGKIPVFLKLSAMINAPCIPVEDGILTTDGTKREGELVYRSVYSVGETERIKRVVEKPYQGDLITLEGANLLPIRVTGNHLVYAVPRKLVQHTNSAEYKYGQGMWKQARDLIPFTKPWKVHDCLYLPTLETRELKEYYLPEVKYDRHKIKSLPITEELMEILGLYLAEGHIQHGVTAVWSFGKMERTLASKVEKYFRNLGLKPYTTEEETSLRVHVGWKALARKLMEDFGQGARMKRIPEWILRLPKNLLRSFLVGYKSGDGCTIKGKRNFDSFTTSSYDLALTLQKAFLQLGKLVSINVTKQPEKIMGRNIKSNKVFIIRLSENPRYFNLVPILRKEAEYWNGKVIDIETESGVFSHGNVLVHNCKLPEKWYTSYQVLKAAKEPLDILEDPSLKAAKESVDEEERRVMRETRPIELPYFRVWEISSDYKIERSLAWKAEESDKKTTLVVNTKTGRISLRGVLSLVIYQEMRKMNYNINGHPGFGGGKLTKDQTIQDLIRDLRKIKII